MAEPMRLFLDLGDAFTKALVSDGGQQRRIRFPSVVARRLLSPDDDKSSLLAEEQQAILRPADFDPAQFPRTRSYPGADVLLEEVGAKAPAAGARYAGWQAATCGADRQLLGGHPTAENVDALVNKSLILARPESGAAVEFVLIVDSGPKAHAIQEYAQQPSRKVAFELRTLRRPQPRRVELEVSSSTIDAAHCAAAALPGEVDLERVGRLLLIDIGYLRTKLAIVSLEGCELQTELADVGVSECVRRVLRDGQDHGLVEDEFAVIRALEKSGHHSIEVAGRRFEVAAVLGSAGAALEEELERGARRVVVDHYGRRAEMCHAVAIIGGGAALVGPGLAARLRAADIGLDTVWVADDHAFFLLTGAWRRHRSP